MSRYQMNDASFDLPEQFKDGTMHLFTVERNGANAFTFVVSRADMEAGDTVDTFAQKLVQQMRKTLPRFELKSLRAREVDGETAREVDYVWVSQGTPLHQRQTIVMSREAGGVDGAGGAVRRAVSFIGTCPNGFTAEWTAQYAQLIGSVSLNEAPAAPFASRMIPAGSTGLVFVLRAADGTLVVVPKLSQLFGYKIDDALDPKVAFFDHTGAPLELRQVTETDDANPQDGWRHPDGTRFMFWTLDPASNATLAARLASVNTVSGVGSLPDVAAVRRYLAEANASGLMAKAG
jgi:hypothetical protein